MQPERKIQLNKYIVYNLTYAEKDKGEIRREALKQVFIAIVFFPFSVPLLLLSDVLLNGNIVCTQLQEIFFPQKLINNSKKDLHKWECLKQFEKLPHKEKNLYLVK